MNQEECKEIKQALELFLNESLEAGSHEQSHRQPKISRSESVLCS